MVVTYDKDLKYGVEAGQIVVTAGKLLTGIEYPAAKWVLISEGDIFRRRKKKKKATERKRRKNKEKRSEVLQISISVITLFMKNMESVFTAESKRSQQMGLKRTNISIEYQGGDNLFIFSISPRPDRKIRKCKMQESRNFIN